MEEKTGAHRRRGSRQAATGSEPRATHPSRSLGVGCLAEGLHLGNFKEIEPGIANQTPGKCLHLHGVEN